MRYIGGKSRIARFLSPIILSTRPRFVVEPFCGALNVSLWLVKDDPTVVVYASDSHSDLVSMWQAVKDGWSPPDSVSRDEYDRLREEAASPLRTFVGYGCSFSGKWFGATLPTRLAGTTPRTPETRLRKRDRYLSASFSGARITHSTPFLQRTMSYTATRRTRTPRSRESDKRSITPRSGSGSTLGRYLATFLSTRLLRIHASCGSET